MSELSEDARAEAVVLLLERGGFATVRNPEGWLTVVARRLEVDAVRQLQRERRAWAELAYVGDYARGETLHGDDYRKHLRALERARRKRKRCPK